MQNNLCKIVGFIKPTNILEFGFGTGHTAVRIAHENPVSEVTAIDERENMVAVGKDLAIKRKVNNVVFLGAEMVEYVSASTTDLSDYDFIYLLYNFHHIKDAPNAVDDKKKHYPKFDFLRKCYDSMSEDSFICIADLFLPSNDDDEIAALFTNRVAEGDASTFWSSLSSVEEQAISDARRVAEFCRRNEHEVGIKVRKREYEYPVTREWLKKAATKIGFRVFFDESVNSVGDAIVLLKKV